MKRQGLIYKVIVTIVRKETKARKTEQIKRIKYQENILLSTQIYIFPLRGLGFNQIICSSTKNQWHIFHNTH